MKSLKVIIILIFESITSCRLILCLGDQAVVGEAVAAKAKLHLMSMATNHLLLQGHEGEVDLQAMAEDLR